MSIAYVIPGEEPASAQAIKRLLLFFDRVIISCVKDEAIVNDNEVEERFPNLRAMWTARGHYPRVGDYEERYDRCLRGAGQALQRQLIQEIESKEVRSIDAGTHWMLYNAALSNVDLVKSAAIDASEKKPDFVLRNTILQGAEISQPGVKSKYQVDYKQPESLHGVHEEWGWVARLRVGRAIKSVRLAQALDASPIALDSVNSNIVLKLVGKTDRYVLSDESMLDAAMSIDTVDNKKLETVLADMSWSDALRLRKEMLPHTHRARDFLAKRARQISNTPFADVESYVSAVKQANSELNELLEREAEAWEALRIGSILKLGGAVGAGIAVPAMVPLLTLINSLLCAGLLGAAALSDELKQLIPARRKVRAHPLFFLEKLSRS